MCGSTAKRLFNRRERRVRRVIITPRTLYSLQLVLAMDSLVDSLPHLLAISAARAINEFRQRMDGLEQSTGRNSAVLPTIQQELGADVQGQPTEPQRRQHTQQTKPVHKLPNTCRNSRLAVEYKRDVMVFPLSGKGFVQMRTSLFCKFTLGPVLVLVFVGGIAPRLLIGPNLETFQGEERAFAVSAWREARMFFSGSAEPLFVTAIRVQDVKEKIDRLESCVIRSTPGASYLCILSNKGHLACARAKGIGIPSDKLVKNFPRGKALLAKTGSGSVTQFIWRRADGCVLVEPGPGAWLVRRRAHPAGAAGHRVFRRPLPKMYLR